jgi:hypothetical protein
MKIAYLMPTYPMTSMTFIRREIEALERLGVNVKRYASRVWHEKLVDARDVAESGRTHYLLTGNTTALVAAFIRELLVNPKGSWRAIRATWQLAANAGGLSIKHFAYLLEAAYLRQRAQLDRIEHIHAHFSTNATTVAMLSRLMGGPNYSFTAHGPDEFDDGARKSIDAKLQMPLLPLPSATTARKSSCNSAARCTATRSNSFIVDCRWTNFSRQVRSARTIKRSCASDGCASKRVKS